MSEINEIYKDFISHRAVKGVHNNGKTLWVLSLSTKYPESIQLTFFDKEENPVKEESIPACASTVLELIRKHNLCRNPLKELEVNK